MRFKKPDRGKLDLSLTSMMDVVFQLIIFFILVTNFASADLPELEPPQPEESMAEKFENQVTRIVNIVPVTENRPDPRTGETRPFATSRAKYALAYDEQFPITAGGMQALTQRLENEKEQEGKEEMRVDLRVDRAIHYREVAPVMDAITDAQIARINLVALVDVRNPQD